MPRRQSCRKPHYPPAIAPSLMVYAYNRTVIDDLLFLDAWEKGLVPWLGAILRVRQIRRANPAIVAGSIGLGIAAE